MSTMDSELAKTDFLTLEFDLVGQRVLESHYYLVQSELRTYSTKGSLKSTDLYHEYLQVEPGDRTAGEADRFTCKKFTVKRGDDAEVNIPSLEGFSYDVNKDLLDENGIDANGELYSVPEDIFEDMEDSTGATLPFEIGYQVYSAFYYYHSYTDYAEPPPKGQGVQNLKRIGDRVIVDGSFAETPIPGKLAKDSAVWKNGEITLEFKGLRSIDDQPCAILGFDSGVCTWSMPMTYMPIMNLKTTGVPNYQGDIYLDLNTFWVRKLEMILSETTRTTMWGIPVENSMPRTHLSIRILSKDEFEMSDR